MRIKIILLFLAPIFIGYYFFKIKYSCRNSQAIVYKLNKKNYCLLVADSSLEWTRGLMNYRKPVDFDGMIFLFPKKSIQNFWNENTFVDLDVYWLDGEWLIGRSFLPSIESSKKPVYLNSPKPVDRVIEIIR